MPTLRTFFVTDLFLVITLALSGCGSPLPPAPTRDSGLDSSRLDGGPREDGSTDSGAPEDTGPAPDGDIDGGGTSIDGGGASIDGSIAIDGDLRDARPGDDGGGDAASFLDGCVPPVCPPPPTGCSYIAATSCTCGRLDCPTGCAAGACSATQYCAYPSAGTCSGATGSCMTRPADGSCSDVYTPVCGCNGGTYMNECDAHLGGVDVAFAGECPVSSDCRTMGCLIGQICRGCPGAGGGMSYFCLPDGVGCS